MIYWKYYPQYDRIPKHLLDIVGIFEREEDHISSDNNDLVSNDVLAKIADELEKINYKVERSKKNKDKVTVPVLFGKCGSLEKYFDADALNIETKTVVEVEAGRAVTNYQFLKDLFQACMMQDIDYLVIAVRKVYKKHKDFENVEVFFDTLYASNRLILPLKGILIIGY